MLEGKYTELTQDSALFTFDGVQYKPKMFYHHGKNQNFDDLLKWANESYEKGIIGVLLTAPFLWEKLTDAQRNMIEPKVKAMWCSGTTAMIDWGGFNAYGNCFIWQPEEEPGIIYLINSAEDLGKYFVVNENSVGGSDPVLEEETKSIIMTCPHCGKRIKL